MPESPDFDQKALNILDVVRLFTADLRSDGQTKALAQTVIAEQLRLVWNARGAADIVKLDASLTSQMGATMAGPYVKNLDRALRTLDR